MEQLKIIIDTHPEVYNAWSFGIKCLAVSEWGSYEWAPAHIEPATKFHVETFGHEISNNV